MNSPLILPMMMFGRFRGYEKEYDPKTKRSKIKKKKNKKGKLVPVKKWIIHREEDGDQGIFPSVNNIYVNKGKAKRLSKPAEDLKEKWATFTKIWAEDNQWEITKGEKIVVELTPYFPNDKIKRDATNAFKLMMDAFEGIIYDNDYYALGRIKDLKTIEEKDEEPYFKVDIYKKEDEAYVLYEQLRSKGVSLPDYKTFRNAYQAIS